MITPPDFYDARGKLVPERRREHGRRAEDDINDDIIRGYAKWAKIVVTHRALFSMLIASATAVGGYAMAMMSTPRELKAVEKRVDSVYARVDRIEDKVEAGAQDRAEIKRSLAWVIYMNCVSLRRTDPNALPPICDVASSRRVP